MTAPKPHALKDAIWDELLNTFKPAFLGRTTVLPYTPLGRDQLAEIARLQLGRVADRIQRHHDAPLHYSEEVVDAIVDRCTESTSGARNIPRILQQEVLPEMSTRILERLGRDSGPGAVELSTVESSFRIALAGDDAS